MQGSVKTFRPRSRSPLTAGGGADGIRGIVVAVAIILTCLLVAPTGSAATIKTRPVALSSAEVQGNSASYWPSASNDGRFVVFDSDASNLVSGDTNATGDVFVRDRLTGTTRRVSISSSEQQGDAPSHSATISADGRYVAFVSGATNLVPGDTNGVEDVFVRDRKLGTTRRISLRNNGGEGNEASFSPRISASGAFVVFTSAATNLAPGDTNGSYDVFVRDRNRQRTRRVSVNSHEVGANGNSVDGSITPDGRYVVFGSSSTNLAKGDTNAAQDIFVRDLHLGTTKRVSMNSLGFQGNGDSTDARMSGDGRVVVFRSTATNLVLDDTNAADDVFIRDRRTSTTKRVSVRSNGNQANDRSTTPSISLDGRYVVFVSQATNLVGDDSNGQPDIFLRDRATKSTKLISVSSSGAQGNGESYDPSISPDGRFAVFVSYATNFMANDTNGRDEVFIRGPLS
jgi:Tol biopolymer transport system component